MPIATWILNRHRRRALSLGSDWFEWLFLGMHRIVHEISVVADAARVGSDASSIRHVRTLIFRSFLTILGIVWITDSLLASEQQAAARAEVVSGTPYGVGVVELSRERALESGWYSDQTIEVKCFQSTIWLPAVKEAKNNDQLLIYFLYQGKFPASIRIAIAGEVQFTAKAKPGNSDPVRHAELLNLWWQTLQEQTHSGISKTLAEPNSDFLAALGQHLQLPTKRRMPSRADASSLLESQFERTLGMLLGFESVRLAMMIDDTNEAVGQFPAELPLPTPVNVQGIRLPDAGIYANTPIESIASRVPNDCFYVRCKSIRNYSWLRQLFINWGGSLNEIVTSPSLEIDVRGRIESQLGINSQQSAESDLDQHLSDVAIIGTDVFFEEGAGIGVLLEAKLGHENEVEKAIQQQRAVARKSSGAVLRSETIHGQVVSILSTADHSVRSFFVRNGRYVLVTNSRDLMSSFLNLRNSNQSLASLSEYRYANANSPEAFQSDIKIYLSDPFFRRITGPAFRIELNRRRTAAKDCRKLEIALLVSKALGHSADSRQALVGSNFLPPDLGLHPDGSRVELVRTEATDSLRGRVGTFIPVADLKPDKANESELLAYQRFSQRYRQEWPAMDPVLACIRKESLSDSVERVHLNIHVTPYARKEYGFLANYLAEPTRIHAAIEGKELMGVSAHLRDNSKRFLAHLGLCDSSIPFHVKQGALVREGERSSENLVEQQSFAAVTPTGRDGLQLLAGLVKSLQTRESHSSSPSTVSANASQPVSVIPFALLRGVLNPADGILRLGDVAVRGLLDLAKLNSIYEDEIWSIYGANSDLRLEVRQRLSQQQTTRQTQIHLHAGGIEQAAMAPYLHAYSYCDARQRSAANAAWLNRWTAGLRASPEGFRNSLEKALHGTLKCTLGGEFTLQKNPRSSMQWTSSAWSERSLASVNDVPPEYRLPFLHWLKNVELDFNLTPTSLNSEVVIDIAVISP